MINSLGFRVLVALVGVSATLGTMSSCWRNVESDPVDVSTLSPEELVFRYVGTGEASKLDSLLESHPDLVNIYEDTYYNTPLHIAALNGYSSVVKVLLEHGADPYIENQNGEIAAESALQGGNLELSKYLREAASKME